MRIFIFSRGYVLATLFLWSYIPVKSQFVGGCSDYNACNYDGSLFDDGSCFYSPEWHLPAEVEYYPPQIYCGDNPYPYYWAENQVCVAEVLLEYTECNNLWSTQCQYYYNLCAYGCEEVVDCTDPDACNYSYDGLCDRGNCIYPGCLDQTAYNYNPFSECGGGECIYYNECGIPEIPGNIGVGFIGLYDRYRWQSEMIYEGGHFNNASLLFGSSFFSPLPGNYVQKWVVVPVSGTITFKWSYYTPPLPNENDQAYFIHQGYNLLSAPNGPPIQNGEITTSVNQGDTIGFAIQRFGVDSDRASLEIYDFRWSGADCVLGCTELFACNFNPLATVNDGSCNLLGCNDPEACNYNPSPYCTDGECIYPNGCIDPTAYNFDPQATCDDGNCIYYNQCGNPVLPGDIGVGFNGYYDTELWSIEIVEGSDAYVEFGNDSLIIHGAENINSLTRVSILCAAAGTYSFDWYYETGELSPQYSPAAYWNGWPTNLTVANGANIQSGSIAFTANQGVTLGFSVQSIYGNTAPTRLIITNFRWPGACPPGCNDPLACNYNAEAGQDDGSCTYPGCTDPAACNYNPLAGCTDNSCQFPGCTDVNAENYDPEAACDNGSCFYINLCGVPVNQENQGLGFTGSYSPENWGIYTGDGDGTVTYYPTSLHIQGNNNGLPVPTHVTMIVPYSGTISFYWEYSTPDQLATLDPVSYRINDTWNELSAYNGPNEQTGYLNIEVEAGDLFQIIVHSNGFGGGSSIDISDFEWPAYCPSGCMDPAACNYDPVAIADDGSCVSPGCQDPGACNYDPAAACESQCFYPECSDQDACNYNPDAFCGGGLCLYPGCTDPEACNYNPMAGCGEGFCQYLDCAGICGGDGFIDACGQCVQPVTFYQTRAFGYTGYRQQFQVPEGVSEITITAYGAQGGGLMDYNFGFPIELANGGPGGVASGKVQVSPGDVLHIYTGGKGAGMWGGYNGGGDHIGPLGRGSGGGGASDVRTVAGDLNSRIIVAGGGGGAFLGEDMVQYHGGSGGGIAGGYGAGPDMQQLASGGTQISGGQNGGQFGTGALSNTGGSGGGGWYGGGTTEMSSGGGGSGYIGGVYAGSMQTGERGGDGLVLLEFLQVFNTTSCVLGCTDPTAINYSPMFTHSNGSCLYGGCTDPLALNYNPGSNYDDGSCQYTMGCTYTGALNYDSNAFVDDGSCLFAPDNTCPQDINDDGMVNTSDLLELLAAFGGACP